MKNYLLEIFPTWEKPRKNDLLNFMDLSELQKGGNKQTRLFYKLCNSKFIMVSLS